MTFDARAAAALLTLIVRVPVLTGVFCAGSPVLAIGGIFLSEALLIALALNASGHTSSRPVAASQLG